MPDEVVKCTSNPDVECRDDETCCWAYQQPTCKKCRHRLEPTNDCVCWDRNLKARKR